MIFQNLKFVTNYEMKTLIVELESNHRAKELSALLSALNFVTKVSTVSKPKAFIAALQEHEQMKNSIVKKKNKAIAKYL